MSNPYANYYSDTPYNYESRRRPPKKGGSSNKPGNNGSNQKKTIDGIKVLVVVALGLLLAAAIALNIKPMVTFLSSPIIERLELPKFIMLYGLLEIPIVEWLLRIAGLGFLGWLVFCAKNRNFQFWIGCFLLGAFVIAGPSIVQGYFGFLIGLASWFITQQFEIAPLMRQMEGKPVDTLAQMKRAGAYFYEIFIQFYQHPPYAGGDVQQFWLDMFNRGHIDWGLFSFPNLIASLIAIFACELMFMLIKDAQDGIFFNGK